MDCQKNVRPKSSTNVQRLWSKEMSNNSSHRKTIRSHMNEFEQIGSVRNIDRPGRPVSVTDQTTRDEVRHFGKKNLKL